MPLFPLRGRRVLIALALISACPSSLSKRAFLRSTYPPLEHPLWQNALGLGIGFFLQKAVFSKRIIFGQMWQGKEEGDRTFSARTSRQPGKRVLNGPFPASFSLFSSFQYSWQCTLFNINFVMTGFESQTSVVGNNRSTNWAATIAQPAKIITKLFRVTFQPVVASWSHSRTMFWTIFKRQMVEYLQMRCIKNESRKGRKWLIKVSMESWGTI